MIICCSAMQPPLIGYSALRHTSCLDLPPHISNSDSGNCHDASDVVEQRSQGNDIGSTVKLRNEMVRPCDPRRVDYVSDGAQKNSSTH